MYGVPMKSQSFKHLFVISLLFNLLFIGALLNSQVILVNGGKMPVQVSLVSNKNTHFAFQEKDEVELYYLSDIFSFGRFNWSIGDFLLIGSGFSLGVYLGYFIIKEIKIRRK